MHKSQLHSPIVLIKDHPWAIESGWRDEGVRAIRLRKLGVPPQPDVSTLKAMLEKMFRTHDLNEHMLLSLPFSGVLPERHRVKSLLARDPVVVVKIGNVKFASSQIEIEGVYWHLPMALTFSPDWDLKELRLVGNSIEFNRAEWARAYAVWKRALEKEIADTEK